MYVWLAVLAVLCASGVSAADLNFCWRGANGYSMTGQMRLPDARLAGGIVTEADVERFAITGYRDGEPLGRWDAADAGAETTWHLRFDPVTMTFLTGGSFLQSHSQGWNANGTVDDCGDPGFGFNSGNNAQDLCINGNFIPQSSIPPDTPLRATTRPVTAACGGPVPIG